VRHTYERLLEAVQSFGPVAEDPKKTSIHLNRSTAFAGVAMRKDAIVLTIKADNDIASDRILTREQTSARRWHLAVRLSKPSDVDAQLISWLKAAYELSA
jgi:hypothetical protein